MRQPRFIRFIRLVAPGAAVLTATVVMAVVVGPRFDNCRDRVGAEMALSDLNRVGVALRQVIADTQAALDHSPQLPDRLYGPGVQPKRGAFNRGRADAASRLLVRDDWHLGAAWKGPYLTEVPIDPWGRAFVLNLSALHHPREVLWILSAGPDGEIQTAPDATTPAGDDVGIPLLR